MNILLVEPDYRRIVPKKSSSKIDDERLAYPPLGLMKIAAYHESRGDKVHFVRGISSEIKSQTDFFSASIAWDRVYISTLFTYHFDYVVKTVNYYKQAVGGTIGKVFVGGIMASLMPAQIFEQTGVYPVEGVLLSSAQIGYDDKVNIDLLTPDYSLLSPGFYAINDTYYGYTTRGCVNKCGWCGVPTIEPTYQSYIDIKPMIKNLRSRFGDKPRLKLMDNNVLASKDFERVISDLSDLGYSKGAFTAANPKRARVVDFNQGLDASLLTNDKMELLSTVNIKPMRIAFDSIHEKATYIKAVTLAVKYDIADLSNYMLFNFKDTPKDLYDRMIVNIDLNREYGTNRDGRISGIIYSYPMRYAPISEWDGDGANTRRDKICGTDSDKTDWLHKPIWTKRFLRNIEIMKGAANGAISPTPELALRTIGSTFDQFLSNLYMPEELLRNRNKHEKKVYEFEPKRTSGTGKVEEFHKFISNLLQSQNERFSYFHQIVTQNSKAVVKKEMENCHDKEIKKWLSLYLI